VVPVISCLDMEYLNLFCASGGGSKGAFQGGVLESLCNRGIHLDGLVGVSTGSIQAGFLSTAAPGLDAQRKKLQELKDYWFSLRKAGDVYRKPLLGDGTLGILCRLAFGKSSLYDFAPLREKLDKALAERPQRPVRLGVVELGTGDFVVERPVDRQGLRDAILASSSIPFFFPPVKPDLVDGGVRDIAPVAAAFRLAAEMIDDDPDLRGRRLRIFVALASPLAAAEDQRSHWDSAKALSVAQRSIDLLAAENYLWDMRGAKSLNSILEYLDAQTCPRPPELRDKLVAEILCIEPTHRPYSSLEFNPEKIRAFWSHGRAQAEAALDAEPT